MHELTKRELQVLEAIKQYDAKYNYPPAYRELGKIIGMKSSSSICRILNKLKEKGYVNWKEGQPRTLHIIKTTS